MDLAAFCVFGFHEARFDRHWTGRQAVLPAVLSVPQTSPIDFRIAILLDKEHFCLLLRVRDNGTRTQPHFSSSAAAARLLDHAVRSYANASRPVVVRQASRSQQRQRGAPADCCPQAAAEQ